MARVWRGLRSAFARQMCLSSTKARSSCAVATQLASARRPGSAKPADAALASALHAAQSSMAQFDHHSPETMPPSPQVTSSDQARRRTAWIVGVTLAALAVIVVIVLYAVDVL